MKKSIENKSVLGDGMLYLDLSIFSLQKMGGISAVWTEYLKRLSHLHDELAICLLSPAGSQKLDQLTHEHAYLQHDIFGRGRYSKYCPYWLRATQTDILHMSYYSWYPQFQGKKIVTVHDLTHEKVARGAQRVAHRWLKEKSLATADVLLCVSEATRRDLFEFYPEIAHRKQIHTILNAAGDHFYYDVGTPQRDTSYILWVGGRQGYKNFDLALHGLRQLRDNSCGLELIAVGEPPTTAELKKVSLLGLQEDVFFYPHQTLEQLRHWYSNAFCLWYLSKHEGFGIPIIEAQQCHCPVICLDMSVTREIGGDSISLLQGDLLHCLQHEMMRLQSVSLRQDLIEKGIRNAARFSWDASVIALMTLYKELQAS